MKALVITRFGGPEVLELQQVPDAHPAPEQVLVKVEAGGLNFADLITARGGYAGTPKPPLTAGREFAGAIEERRSGRRVMGYTQWAAFAEKTVAHRNLVWPVPENWTAEQAAAFPVNFFTAYFAYWKAGLRRASPGRARPDSCRRRRSRHRRRADRKDSRHRNVWDLFFGRQAGASARTRPATRHQLQAARLRRRDQGSDARRRRRRGFEMLGGEHVAKSVKCVRDFGRVIVYGAATGETPQLDTRLLYAKGASVHGLWLSYLSANRPLMESAWKQLSEWMAAGKLHPVIGKVFPLEGA